MLRPRNAPSQERFVQSQLEPPAPCAAGQLTLAARPAKLVRRRLSRESGRAVEVLGHAIEYLADESVADPTTKGPFGNADPRIAAIQLLKALNRTIYLSGRELQPPLRRIRRWFIGERAT